MNKRSGTVLSADAVRLNAICPYFTMFPLEFPLGVLRTRAKPDSRVLDPFCGRGTTNFAARLLGLKTIGIDASRVAAATTQAKLVAPAPQEIVGAAKAALSRRKRSIEVPEGDFWRLAYHEDVLRDLCRIRHALMDGSIEKPLAAALRGIILGALHGPVGLAKKSYFSNQSPRTYGPKPAYAVRFWTERKLFPPRVDVIEIIGARAQRYYGNMPSGVEGAGIMGDSRNEETVDKACESVSKFDWVITSPPYYGMRTYIPDQWIRNWFLGGSSAVDYSCDGQISHSGRDKFVADLRKVWENVGAHCKLGATLVIRFGSIQGQLVEDPVQLIADSLRSTGWVKKKVESAKSAASGRRQADTFRGNHPPPCEEIDVWARWEL